MRLEMVVPDNTRPEVKARLTELSKRLSERPELVEEIGFCDDAGIQAMFTPERLAHIAKSDAEIDAGDYFTTEQVDEHFKQKHEEWQRQHQH